MPFEDLKKIAALVEAGATVVGPPPTGMAGMILNPEDPEQFKALESRVWNGLDGTNVTRREVGAGQIFRGQTAREVLQGQERGTGF